VASLLDQLLNEIATITGLSVDEVNKNFTKEQLDHLLQVSKCEDESSVAPIATNLEDISCKDDGAPSDLVNDLKNTGNFPEGLKDAQKSDYKKKDKDKPFDGSECIESVQEVNADIKKQMDDHMEHNILLNRLYELEDNLKPLEYYYKERAKRMSEILGDFKPILAEMKRLRDNIDYHKNSLIPPQVSTINYQNSQAVPDSTILSNATTERDRLQAIVDADEVSFNAEEAKRNTEEQKYPLMQNGNITNYGDTTNPSLARRLQLVSQVKSTIGTSMISSIGSGLEAYSEYIDINVKTPAGNYTQVLQTPLVGFEIKFQDLNYMMLDKEKFNIETGDRFVYKERFLIKDNPLLLKNSFFTGAPGYTISNTAANQDNNSKGAIYTQYYNLLDDPTNNFFTPTERGLSSSISQLDPKLRGQDSITKKEKQTDYFISSLDKMQNFYKNFDTIFEAKRQQVRSTVRTNNLTTSKSQLELVARYDVELLLALGRVNLFHQPGSTTMTNPDGSTSIVNTGMSTGSQTAVDAISNANLIFTQRLADLQEEIIRLEKIVKEDKPTPEKIKAALKAKSTKCFEDMEDDADGEAGCSDVKAVLGSDPFFESLDGIDPSLPNFSQGCYWKEFAKLATMQGLFPMINNPTTFRYWPVGLVIPTPALLIKIPLPQIWIPLITISTPLGVLVVFLNINGIFISPVIFFLSASGYKQHLVTVRGSSDKFGSDRNDVLIKPLIQIPLATQAKLDIAQAGSLKPEDNMTEEEAAKVGILQDKKAQADADGDTVRSYKAEKEIADTKSQAVDRVKPETAKMADAADKGEEAAETVANVKKKIFKTMDDLGKPPINRINKLKEQSVERADTLKAEKLTAMENGESERVKEINEELKSDGLDLDAKKNAYIDDLLDYFDTITFPTEILPKETDKLDPKPESEDDTGDKSEEMSSSLDKEFVSDQSAKVKTMIGVNIAKHKEDIEAEMPSGTLNVDTDTDEIKETLKTALDTTAGKTKGDGSKPTNVDSTSLQLRDAKDKMDNASSSDEIVKAKKDYENTQKSVSKKMDAARTKQTLSLTPTIIGLLSGVNVALDPFAKCCPKDTFSIGFPFPPLVTAAISTGVAAAKGAIDGLSANGLKSLFGGKSNVGAKDMRLGLLSIVQNSIPDSVSIPKPELNLSAGTDMFSGILGGLSMPQASFPSALGSQQLKKKVTIDLSIVKPTIKAGLEQYLQNNLLSKNSQSLETDFIHANPNDIKAFMKKFIDSQTDAISSKLDTYYKIINAAKIKNGNGMDLNVLEKAVFNVPPFGPAAKALFIVKGKLKFAKTKSKAQFIISEDALKIASGILKTALTPIVSNPVAGLLIAGAGATSTTGLIRKIHPILSADDIPPWERMTMKNVLFLLFLDEFNSVGADQVGFFRSYL
jgi:hypothetical protein